MSCRVRTLERVRGLQFSRDGLRACSPKCAFFLPSIRRCYISDAPRCMVPYVPRPLFPVDPMLSADCAQVCAWCRTAGIDGNSWPISACWRLLSTETASNQTTRPLIIGAWLLRGLRCALARPLPTRDSIAFHLWRRTACPRRATRPSRPDHVGRRPVQDAETSDSASS